MTELLAMVLLVGLCGCAQQRVSLTVKPVEVSSDGQPAIIDVNATSIVADGSTNIDTEVTMTNRSVHVSGSSAALAFVPSINVNVAPPQKRPWDKSKEPMNPDSLFPIIVALSAYLATVRQVLFSKLPDSNSTEKKKLKDRLLLLMLADVPLVVCAVLLALNFLWMEFTGFPFFGSIYKWVMGIFTGTVLLMAIYHAYSWWKTIRIKTT